VAQPSGQHEHDRTGGRVPDVASTRRPLAWTFGFVLAGALYLLLIDTLDLPELYAGAAVAVLCALVFEAAREQGFAEARPALRWFPRVARALVRVPADAARLSLSAFEQLMRPRARRGEFVAIRFAQHARDDPREAGRRALAEAAGSLAPNTIVVGIDVERGLILAHQLRRGGGADAVDPLGLR
jgi:hypothetical protein